MTSRAIAGDDTGVSAYGLFHSGNIVASATGFFKPAIALLDMLTTPAGGARPSRWPWLGWCDLSASFWFRSVNPLVGEPPTGKPDAGDPPVRFGGRGDGQPLLPIPIYKT